MSEISKKTKRSKREHKEEEQEEDHGFLMALIEDRIGRRVVLACSLLWIALPMYILGVEHLWIMLLASFLTGGIVFIILHYVCDINVKELAKLLYYGSTVIKKD